LEKLSRLYATFLAPYVGPGKDVPAPDVNTNGQIMAWMVDEYAKCVGQWTPGMITGKPLSIWWSAGRISATGYGAYYVLEEYLRSLWDNLQWKTIAVQGAGNAAQYFIEKAVAAWAILVAVSDSRGAVYSESGIDTKALFDCKGSGWSVLDCPWISSLSQDVLLTLDVDILVPAALEDQIRADNVADIRSGLIVEIANGPTSKDASDFLFKRWSVILPDVLANAWWVTVSYFEQVQNDMNYYRSESEVDKKMQDIMVKATREVVAMAQEKNISMRMVVLLLSIFTLIGVVLVRFLVLLWKN